VSVCVPHIVARQRLGTFPWQRIHETVEELLEEVFLCVCVCGLCRIKVESLGLSVYSSIVARQWLGKHVLAAISKS
jgi:hypothetical protein